MRCPIRSAQKKLARRKSLRRELRRWSILLMNWRPRAKRNLPCKYFRARCRMVALWCHTSGLPGIESRSPIVICSSAPIQGWRGTPGNGPSSQRVFGRTARDARPCSPPAWPQSKAAGCLIKPSSSRVYRVLTIAALTVTAMTRYLCDEYICWR